MTKRRMRQCRLEGGCEGRRRRKSDSNSCTVNLHGGLVMLEVLSPVEDPALGIFDFVLLRRSGSSCVCGFDGWCWMVSESSGSQSTWTSEKS